MQIVVGLSGYRHPSLMRLLRCEGIALLQRRDERQRARPLQREVLFNACFLKRVLPIGTWMIPEERSTRYSICPALIFCIVSVTSVVTVPALALGIKPLGPRIRPSLGIIVPHQVRCCDCCVKIEPSINDFINEIVCADEICASFFSLSCQITFGEDNNTCRLSCAVWQCNSTADILVPSAEGLHRDAMQDPPSRQTLPYSSFSKAKPPRQPCTSGVYPPAL